MCETLSVKMGNSVAKQPKVTQPTSTVSKAPTDTDNGQFGTINLDEFNDFVPIDNNANDFELGQIISEIERQNMKHIQNEQNQIHDK